MHVLSSFVRPLFVVAYRPISCYIIKLSRSCCPRVGMIPCACDGDDDDNTKYRFGYAFVVLYSFIY